jgi:hypothetical protein
MSQAHTLLHSLAALQSAHKSACPKQGFLQTNLLAGIRLATEKGTY